MGTRRAESEKQPYSLSAEVLSVLKRTESAGTGYGVHGHLEHIAHRSLGRARDVERVKDDELRAPMPSLSPFVAVVARVVASVQRAAVAIGRHQQRHRRSSGPRPSTVVAHSIRIC